MCRHRHDDEDNLRAPKSSKNLQGSLTDLKSSVSVSHITGSWSQSRLDESRVEANRHTICERIHE